MKILLGKDFFASKSNKDLPVVFDTEKLINGHMLIVGSSGVGKSYTLRRLINGAIASSAQIRFHVFDVHGDLELPGASTVQFSEQAPYGLNPFRVNPNIHFGGVRKAIQAFTRTINQASSVALGLKQEAVLRNLLVDVFKEYGFLQDDPGTWALNALESRMLSAGADNRIYLDVPLADKDRAKALGARWDPDKRHWWVRTDAYRGPITEWHPAFQPRAYPTLADVVRYARWIHLERFLGSDQQAVRAVGVLNAQARAFQRKLLESVRARRADDMPSAGSNEAFETAKQKAIEAFTDYVQAVKTGEELEGLLKYDSPDVLKSVVDRLSNLLATGIYRDQPPPFDPGASIWRYKLNALSKEEKKMFVLFSLQELFNNAVERGQTDDVVEVVVLDELSTYTAGAAEEGIIGVIARESRKFGLALWAANQTPSGVPESLISSAAAKVVLGLDEMYWQQAVTKLRIESKLLDWIRPHSTMAVQLKEKGALKNRWWWTLLP